MITLTNFGSGELSIDDGEGLTLKLARDQAQRLIMAARMHTVAELLEKLPTLIPDQSLTKKIRDQFEGKTSTERWNLKEKFARLNSLSKGFEPEGPEGPKEVVEKIRLESSSVFIRT